MIKFTQNHLTLLIFVRRTCMLLRRGKTFAADALLGRFLPRLGPLVATQAASFVLAAPFMKRELVMQRELGAAKFQRPALG